MTAAFARVPELLAQHLLLAFSALLLGLIVSLPLAVLSSRNRTVGRIALGFASLIQTIPMAVAKAATRAWTQRLGT